MNTMIRFYSGGRDAQQKQAMAFDLSDHDHQLLKFGGLFRERFMDINVSIPLEEALDLSWKTLAECFTPEQLLMKQELIDKYFPKDVPSAEAGLEPEPVEDTKARQDAASAPAPDADRKAPQKALSALERDADTKATQKDAPEAKPDADAKPQKPVGSHGKAATQ